jgi:glycosyltransferase involved in cell wall biosynthesis
MVMTQTIPPIEESLTHGRPAPELSSLLGVGARPDGSDRAALFPGAVGTLSPRESERPPVVELAVPVYNEECILESSILRLRSYLDQRFPFEAAIVIVDNASTDRTWEVASRLAATIPGVSAMLLEEKGKGRAIRAAWSASRAEIVAYMDVDLSTDLGAFLPLVAPLLSGHSEISIGSRFAPGAHVLRGAKREVFSRGYNLLLRMALQNRFSDATCGFKAARREAVAGLLPLVSDDHWFFDTELLVLAERNGFRIHEVPVDWVDDGDSRVNVHSVARDDLRGIARLVRRRAAGREAVASSDAVTLRPQAGQATRYAGVGLLSSITYLVLFFLLRNVFGVFGSNVIALAVSSMVGTVAHARFTFGPKSGMGLRQIALTGLAAFATAVSITTLALGVEAWTGSTSAMNEVVAILAGIVAASLVRLILLRALAYRMHLRSGRPSDAA